MRHTIRSQIFTGNYRDLLIVGTEGDEGQSADEVLRIHDAKLAKMGTDNLTRGAIDSYRKRHFGTADPLVPGRAKPRPTPPEPVATKPEQIPAPPVADAVSRQQHADKLMADLNRLQADHNARVAASKVPTPAEQATAGDAPESVPTAPPEPEASAPAAAPTAPPTPKPAPEGEICERCGAAVTKSQAKLSQLFMSKTLCKTCTEAP